MITPERIFVIVGAVVALLLQIIVAPYIAVFSAVPNFIVAYVCAIAIARAHSFGSVVPFVLGLLFDIVSGGPVGAMAFSLTLFSSVASRVFAGASNDTIFMAIAFVALSVLLVDLSYGIFLLLFGYNASLFEAIAYRIGPCFVYDVIIGLVVFLAARRFVQPAAVPRTDITQLR